MLAKITVGEVKKRMDRGEPILLIDTRSSSSVQSELLTYYREPLILLLIMSVWIGVIVLGFVDLIFQFLFPDLVPDAINNLIAQWTAPL
jgi:hypothetical protein